MRSSVGFVCPWLEGTDVRKDPKGSLPRCGGGKSAAPQRIDCDSRGDNGANHPVPVSISPLQRILIVVYIHALHTITGLVALLRSTYSPRNFVGINFGLAYNHSRGLNSSTRIGQQHL